MTNVSFYEFKIMIEGVEIPFISGSVSAAVNGAATAQVNIVPVDEAKYIVPKTLVHIFWKCRGAWRVIFEGEVIGRGFTKKSDQRMVVYYCMGFESYWHQAYRLLQDATHLVSDTGAPKYYGCNGWWASFTQDADLPISNFIAKIFGDAGSISSGFEAVFDKMVGTNDFFKFVQRRLSLKERVFTVNNSFAFSLMKSYVLGAESASNMDFTPVATLHEIIMDLIQRIFYQYVPITSPAIQSNGMPLESLFCPELDFTAIPRCNVIFPEQYAEFSFSQDFMSEPTRTIGIAQFNSGDKVEDGGIPAPLSLDHYIAPQNIFTGVRAASSEAGSLYKGLTPVISYEEFIRGMVIHFESYSNKESETGLVSGPQDVILRELMQRHAYVMEYIHYKFKYEARQIQNLVLRFNPFIVCGLPGLVLDPDWGGFSGRIMGYTHSFEARGTCSTVVQMGYVRLPTAKTAPDYFPDSLKKEFEGEAKVPLGFFDFQELPNKNEMGTPLWFDENLNPFRIGKTIYEGYLGLPSGASTIMTAFGEKAISDFKSMGQAIDDLMTRYNNLSKSDPESRNALISNYIYREIATENQIMTATGKASPILDDTAMNAYKKMSAVEKKMVSSPEYSGGVEIPETKAGFPAIVDGAFIIPKQKFARALRTKLTNKNVFYKG